ncbi:MAG: HipA domain-containing protein [Ignavibacteriaceae bacterium]
MNSLSNKCLYCYNSLNENEIDFHHVCSKKLFGTVTPPLIDFSLNEVKDLAIKILGKSISVTGVQPKLSLDYEKRKGNRLTIVGLWGKFILKPPFEEYPQMPEIEDLTMHLAKLVNIKIAEHSLIRLKSGELAYISRRFDRTKNGKLHLEDMAQLTGTLTEHKYRGSMEKIGKVILSYSHFPGNDAIRLFELTLFSFLTGNSDMHLKSFSLLRDVDDEIILSPAYDLLSTKLLIPADKEELALTLNGKKNNLRKKDFDYFAGKLSIHEKTLAGLYKRYDNSLSQMHDIINKSFLSNDMKEKYSQLIDERHIMPEVRAKK